MVTFCWKTIDTSVSCVAVAEAATQAATTPLVVDTLNTLGQGRSPIGCSHESRDAGRESNGNSNGVRFVDHDYVEAELDAVNENLESFNKKCICKKLALEILNDHYAKAGNAHNSYDGAGSATQEDALQSGCIRGVD